MLVAMSGNVAVAVAGSAYLVLALTALRERQMAAAVVAQVEPMVKMGPLPPLAEMVVVTAEVAAEVLTQFREICRVLAVLAQSVLLPPETQGNFQVQMSRALALEGLCFLVRKVRSLGSSQAA